MVSFLLDWVAKYFSLGAFSKHKKTLTPQVDLMPQLDEKAITPVDRTSINSFLSDELQTEIRAERKFSLAEAIGRESGSFMKGESAIPRPVRAANEIKQFIANHSSEPSGVLATELANWCIADIRLSRQLETPLTALSQVIESLLNESTSFYEFYRQVAIAQSKMTGERPYFQQPDQPPHPRAEHTHSSIYNYLLKIAKLLQET